MVVIGSIVLAYGLVRLRISEIPESLLVLMGKWSWWIPKWLDRILPDIDVEGAKLHALQQRSAETVREPVGVS